VLDADPRGQTKREYRQGRESVNQFNSSRMNEIIALDLTTGQPTRVRLDGVTISALDIIEARAAGDLPVLAPAFWDIQTNGRFGISFSSPTLTEEDVAEVLRAHRPLGVSRLCPTLITAPADDMRRGVETIASACERHADLDRMVLGIHLEGPWISPEEGYRGAHPLHAVREPDPAEFDRLQESAQGRITLVTLAPERPGAIELIRHMTMRGVVVSIGHTAADAETISLAVDAGARLSTHLGNGIAAVLARHPNPIFAQGANDQLFASFIADGQHLDRATLSVLARAKTLERVILVSDASPLAGLPAGIYGEWEVLESGRVVVRGTPYLAGANEPLSVGLANLCRATGWPLSRAIQTVTVNPARLLGLAPPVIATGEPASFVLFEPSTPTQPGPVLRASWIEGLKYTGAIA
jgi:N-acetylglucosamine-6-phosphate deacetylase